jgi:high-affinity iron transporter
MTLASFVITFREALEAALIVGIVAAYLRKVGHPEAYRYLFLGTAGAVLASIGFAWLLQTIYRGLIGVYESLFEGATALVASGFLTYMIFWMTRNARKIKGELERKLEPALSSGQQLGVAAIAFITVFREGIETVLFLTAVFFADPSGTALGLMLGIAAVGVVSLLIMKSSFRLNLQNFFKYTSMILLLFAAGLIGFASHELAEAAEVLGLNLGFLGEQAFSVNVAAGSMFNEQGAMGSLLSDLLGYTLSPEWIRLTVYLGYWLVIGGYLTFAYRGISAKTRSPS